MAYWVFPLEMADSFCWELLMVWQGTFDWAWIAMSVFVVGYYMLVRALSWILMVCGWPLWIVCKYFDLNTAGMKSLPFHVMQECSMVISSFSCQKGINIMGRLVQCSGQPFNYWSVLSPWVAFWICCTGPPVRCGVSSGVTYSGCFWIFWRIPIIM